MKISVSTMLFVTLLLFNVYASASEEALTMTTTELKGIAKENMRHSDQIRFSFGNAVIVRPTINEEDNTCTLSFVNLPYTSSQAANLVKKIKGASASISSVELSRMDNDDSSEGTQIKISFSSKDIHVNVQNFENPHQLVLDITSMSRLFGTLKQNNVISHAFNLKKDALFIAQLRA